MDCVFFLVLVFFAFFCRDMLKKCHQPVCTNQVWVFTSLHSRNSWYRQDWRYLLFKDVSFSVLVGRLCFFVFSLRQACPICGDTLISLFLYTSVHLWISGVFFCTSYSEPKKLSIISRKLWHVQNLNFHCSLSRQTVSMWGLYSDFCNSSNYE